jgi:hypothetical protein
MSERDCFKGSKGSSRKAEQGSLVDTKHSLPLMRSSERMCLTAEQHSQIAATYEKAAADETLPSQLRTAFVKKAKWFRVPDRGGERYLSLAEKLSRARATRGMS